MHSKCYYSEYVYVHSSSKFFLCLECGCDSRAEAAMLDSYLRDASNILRLLEKHRRDSGTIGPLNQSCTAFIHCRFLGPCRYCLCFIYIVLSEREKRDEFIQLFHHWHSSYHIPKLSFCLTPSTLESMFSFILEFQLHKRTVLKNSIHLFITHSTNFYWATTMC